MGIMAASMRRTFTAVVALVGIGLGSAVAAGEFRAKTADKYPAKQKQGDLIVAVKPFVSGKDQQSAFGKVRPYQHGIMPLLLVLSNTGTNIYSLENMQVRFIAADRESLDPIRGDDLASFNPAGHQPTRRNVPGVPGLSKTRVKKGPLNRPQIIQSEFMAPIVTPKSTASGFVYFWTGTEASLAGASAYISGIYDITNGRDLFYFEIPLRRGR